MLSSCLLAFTDSSGTDARPHVVEIYSIFSATTDVQALPNLAVLYSSDDVAVSPEPLHAPRGISHSSAYWPHCMTPVTTVWQQVLLDNWTDHISADDGVFEHEGEPKDSSMQFIMAMNVAASIEYVDTKDQAAGIFTKALQPQKWGAALNLLSMRADLPIELSSLKKPKG